MHKKHVRGHNSEYLNRKYKLAEALISFSIVETVTQLKMVSDSYRREGLGTPKYFYLHAPWVVRTDSHNRRCKDERQIQQNLPVSM